MIKVKYFIQLKKSTETYYKDNDCLIFEADLLTQVSFVIFISKQNPRLKHGIFQKKNHLY